MATRPYEHLAKHEIEAVRLLAVYTAHHYDIYLLAGPARASCRKHVMSSLTDIPTAISKSGVTALREALYKLADIPEACERGKEECFVEWAKAIENTRTTIQSIIQSPNN